METDRQQNELRGLARVLEEILHGQPRLPAIGPFPQQRNYLDSIIAYTTALRVQQQRHEGAEDASAEWPSGLAQQLRKQTGTLGHNGLESQYLGVWIPEPLSSEEWQQKYAPIFAKYTALGRTQEQPEGEKVNSAKQSH